MTLHKHQLYLLEQHSESFNIGSAFTRINTEGKVMIMKLGPDTLTLTMVNTLRKQLLQGTTSNENVLNNISKQVLSCLNNTY